MVWYGMVLYFTTNAKIKNLKSLGGIFGLFFERDFL